MVQITWDIPNINGAPIMSYRISIQQKDGQYSEQTHYCNGLDSELVTDRKCLIPLLTLQDSTYNLVQGDSVVVIVTGTNLYGESLASLPGYGAIIVRVPSPPVGLADNKLVTNAARIGFTWNDGLNTGGSPIISYRITYDQSTGTWVTLATGIIPRSYTTTVTLTPRAEYTFKVEALNSVGYSLTSATIKILCAQQPDQPLAPTTSFSGLSVVVEWKAPLDRGTDITSYTI